MCYYFKWSINLYIKPAGGLPSDGKESSSDVGDRHSIPGSERYLGEKNGYSFSIPACC